jgi:hypothetical protein
VIREQKIDCIYGLFQEYDPRLFAAATGAIQHDISTLLRILLLERQRGAFDTPIVRHWGFDIQQLDPDVAYALDAHIFCNRGAGFELLRTSGVIAFMDSDRPKGEFMNDDFAPRLSDSDGEIHTVCIGRPFGIDYLAATRHGIHVHIYGNNYDKVWPPGIGDETRLRRFVHVHPSLQTIGANWAEVKGTKSRWVREFSRYDAGWSYIGDPLPWKPLENRAAIPNRLSTYILAGIPIITDRRPGFYRYHEPHRLRAAIDLDGDYGTLRERLESERRSRAGAASARCERSGYSFDATIDSLVGELDRARTEYFSRGHARARFHTSGRRRIVSFGWDVPAGRSDRVRAVAGAWIRAGRRALRMLRPRT